MNKKRCRYLVICLAGWIMFIVALYVMVPRFMYQCKLEQVVPQHVVDNSKEQIFVLTGEGITDAIYVNGNLVPEENYIRLTDEYVIFNTKAEWLGGTEIEIYHDSVVPFLKASNVLCVEKGAEELPLIEFSDEYLSYYEEKENLRDNFIEYLKKLQESSYRIYIAICDEGTGAIDNDMMNLLRELGMQTELPGKYRYSYVGVFENGQSLYEEYSGTAPVLYADENVSVASAGLNAGDFAYINVNGKEVAVNQRGINLVIYDAAGNRVVESVAIDTCTDRKMTRLDVEK